MFFKGLFKWISHIRIHNFNCIVFGMIIFSHLHVILTTRKLLWHIQISSFIEHKEIYNCWIKEQINFLCWIRWLSVIIVSSCGKDCCVSAEGIFWQNEQCAKHKTKFSKMQVIKQAHIKQLFAQTEQWHAALITKMDKDSIHFPLKHLVHKLRWSKSIWGIVQQCISISEVLWKQV